MQTKSCFVVMPFGEKTDVNGEVIRIDGAIRLAPK